MASTQLRPRRSDPKDFLGIDHLLSDEERDIRDTVRAFVAGPGRAVRRRLVRGGDDPAASWRASSASSGVLGMHLRATAARARARPPTAWPAWSSRPATAACARSSRCRGRWRCTRSGAGAREEQKHEWLPRMAAGEAIGCFGLTEPDAGSDPGSMRTARAATATTGSSTARRCGSPTARSPTSRSSGPRTDEGVRGFLVPKGTTGFTTQDIHRKLSLRASVTSELLLDDVRLPAAAMLPEADLAAGAAVVPERGALRHRLGRRRRRPRVLRSGARLQPRSASPSAARSPPPRSSSRSSPRWRSRSTARRCWPCTWAA